MGCDNHSIKIGGSAIVDYIQWPWAHHSVIVWRASPLACCPYLFQCCCVVSNYTYILRSSFDVLHKYNYDVCECEPTL